MLKSSAWSFRQFVFVVLVHPWWVGGWVEETAQKTEGRRVWSGDDAHRTWCGRGRVSPIRVSVLLCSGYATDGEAEPICSSTSTAKKELEKYTRFFKGYSYYHKAGVIEDMEENFSRHKEDLL